MDTILAIPVALLLAVCAPFALPVIVIMWLLGYDNPQTCSERHQRFQQWLAEKVGLACLLALPVAGIVCGVVLIISLLLGMFGVL